MKAYERFLKYVSVWTTSDETSETVPSADRETGTCRVTGGRDERTGN